MSLLAGLLKDIFGQGAASVGVSHAGFAESASAFTTAEPPAWTLLDADLHLHSLHPDSVSLSLLLMIPDTPGCVLDVGCFCGGNGRWLKARFPACHITGVEMLEKAAAVAMNDYDRVIVGRLEDVDFASEGLLLGRFDAIIAGDVLEHMVNPWQALQRLKPLLSPAGALYASIPNVRNLRVVQALAKGLWPYDRFGIKDVTHLRFFTKAEIEKMFAETGWVIDAIDYKFDAGLMALVEGRDLESINTFEMDGLTLTGMSKNDVMEYLTVQFLVRASPAK